MDVTVLTIPRSGTHFMMYFLLVQLDVIARYAHIRPRNESRISNFLDTPPHPVIYTVPTVANIKQSLNGMLQLPEMDLFVDDCKSTYDNLLPKLTTAGALSFNVVKHAGSENELRAIVTALGLTWDSQYTDLINAWPAMGVRQNNARMTALKNKITDANRGI